MIVKKKIWPEYFKLIKEGNKNCEVRVADFDIGKGDTLLLQEYDPKTKKYTGKELSKKVKLLTTIKLDKMNKDMFPRDKVEKFGFHIIELE